MWTKFHELFINFLIFWFWAISAKINKKSDQKSFVTFPGLNFDYDHST